MLALLPDGSSNTYTDTAVLFSEQRRSTTLLLRCTPEWCGKSMWGLTMYVVYNYYAYLFGTGQMGWLAVVQLSKDYFIRMSFNWWGSGKSLVDNYLLEKQISADDHFETEQERGQSIVHVSIHSDFSNIRKVSTLFFKCLPFSRMRYSLACFS